MNLHSLGSSSFRADGWCGWAGDELVIAMREHNKAQKAAAAAGQKTEGSFGKMADGRGPPVHGVLSYR